MQRESRSWILPRAAAVGSRIRPALVAGQRRCVRGIVERTRLHAKGGGAAVNAHQYGIALHTGRTSAERDLWLCGRAGTLASAVHRVLGLALHQLWSDRYAHGRSALAAIGIRRS